MCNHSAHHILSPSRHHVTLKSAPTIHPVHNFIAFHPVPVVRAFTTAVAHGIHGMLLLWPSTLSVDWSHGSFPISNHPFTVDFLRGIAMYSLYLFIMPAMVWHMTRRATVHVRTKLRRSLLLCLLMIIIPFLPAANIHWVVGFEVAERVLYLPSIGFCILVGWILCQTRYARMFVSVIVTLMVARNVVCSLPRFAPPQQYCIRDRHSKIHAAPLCCSECFAMPET